MTTSNAELERHPISADFPEMMGDRLNALVDSMRRRGYDSSEPITLFEGKILDGWNRYRASQTANVTANFVNFEGDFDSAVFYSIDKNTARRQLSKRDEVYALLRINGQLPEEKQMSDAVIMARTGSSATGLANARKMMMLYPEVAADIADGKASAGGEETRRGIHDHYAGQDSKGGFSISARTSKRLSEGRTSHPFHAPRQTAINQAIEMWSAVCQHSGAPVVVEIVEQGKYGKIVVEPFKEYQNR